MHLTFPETLPAGIVVSVTQNGKTISLWSGGAELIAHLSQKQADIVAHALTQPAGATQIVGLCAQIANFSTQPLRDI